jgi:hypothetical protein
VRIIISIGLLALFGLPARADLVSIQVSGLPAYTYNGYYVGPAQATDNGAGPFDFWCDDFTHETYVPTTYYADVSTIGTLNTARFRFDRRGTRRSHGWSDSTTRCPTRHLEASAISSLRSGWCSTQAGRAYCTPLGLTLGLTRFRAISVHTTTAAHASSRPLTAPVVIVSPGIRSLTRLPFPSPPAYCFLGRRPLSLCLWFEERCLARPRSAPREPEPTHRSSPRI